METTCSVFLIWISNAKSIKSLYIVNLNKSSLRARRKEVGRLPSGCWKAGMAFLLFCAFLKIGYTRLSFLMWGILFDSYIILKPKCVIIVVWSIAKLTWVQAARMRHSPTCTGLSWQAWQTCHQHLRFCEVNVWYDGWSMNGNVMVIIWTRCCAVRPATLLESESETLICHQKQNNTYYFQRKTTFYRGQLRCDSTQCRCPLCPLDHLLVVPGKRFVQKWNAVFGWGNK